jgi:hypothetical protein
VKSVLTFLVWAVLVIGLLFGVIAGLGHFFDPIPVDDTIPLSDVGALAVARCLDVAQTGVTASGEQAQFSTPNPRVMTECLRESGWRFMGEDQ